MMDNLLNRILFCSLISLLLFSCNKDKAKGFYKLTKHDLVTHSCRSVEAVQIFSPERITQYFKLQYEGFSLPTYILTTAKQILLNSVKRCIILTLMMSIFLGRS